MLRQEAKDGGATGGRGRSAGRPGRARGRGPRSPPAGLAEVFRRCILPVLAVTPTVTLNLTLTINVIHQWLPSPSFYQSPPGWHVTHVGRGANIRPSVPPPTLAAAAQLRIAPRPPSPLHHHHHHGTLSDASGKAPLRPDSPRSREAASHDAAAAAAEATPGPPLPPITSVATCATFRRIVLSLK
ncbi:uncharacterized protein LOC142931072 isoform X2 [Petromyzon marinus]|uniref:uncharacterized protein LOC142931072 isoform X2 n=1 Tax=Petromyzon marinus TaxID=7757 RepID=UPI003F6F4D04